MGKMLDQNLFRLKYLTKTNGRIISFKNEWTLLEMDIYISTIQKYSTFILNFSIFRLNLFLSDVNNIIPYAMNDITTKVIFE